MGDKCRVVACMKYVAEHGNTMPNATMAQDWLAKSLLRLIEQKEEFDGK